MKNNFFSVNMKSSFIRSIILKKMILFLFLGVFSTNAFSQCSVNLLNSYSDCNGNSVTVQAFGGAFGITYLWSTGESTSVITVDSTVTNLWLITSDTTTGCVDTAFTTVTIIDPLLNPIPSPVNSCFGDTVTLEVGNFPTVSNANILWSTGESTTSIVVSPPVPGEFISVTVSENGIQCIDSVLVLVNPLPQINTLFEDDINGILPNNQPPCTGQIGVQGLGGTPGYTYSWTAGGQFFPATGSTITSLCENTYCVTVTDANGCQTQECYDIEWTPCDLSVTSATPIPCYGDSSEVNVFSNDTTYGLGPIPIVGADRFIWTAYSLPSMQIVAQDNGFWVPGANIPVQYTFTLPAGEYIFSCYDKSWEDSCYMNYTITQPDPIVIYTTSDSSTTMYENDGWIIIDSITGGVGGYSWTWYDSSYANSGGVLPANILQIGGDTLDSLYFSHEFYGGYSILATDTNGCESDTTIYVLTNQTPPSIDTIIIKHETCWDFQGPFNDGEITVFVVDSSVPPMYYVWFAVSDVTVDGVAYTAGDTIRSDTTTFAFPPNHYSSTLSGLSPGAYNVHIYDYFHNDNYTEPNIIIVNAADSIYPIIEPPNRDTIIDCATDLFLSAIAFPQPPPFGNAQLVPDSNLVADNNGLTSVTLDFSAGQPTGATWTLYDAPNRTYMLKCSGTITDANGVNYDPAFSDWDPFDPTGGTATEPQDTTWSWNNSTTNIGNPPLLNINEYTNTHEYIWMFNAPDNGATQVIGYPNLYDHEISNITTGFNGQFQCEIWSIVDTIMYTYEWEAFYTGTNNSVTGGVISTADTCVTIDSQTVCMDYVVTITNTNGCENRDTITVCKDLEVLDALNLTFTDVLPCFGDLTGTIDVQADPQTGIPGYTYALYDDWWNPGTMIFPHTPSGSFPPPGQTLGAGIYTVEIKDTIGCLGFFQDTIFHPDTIYACGVDESNDTTFYWELGTAYEDTIWANDTTTWSINLGYLAQNFQYYLEVLTPDGFGLTSLQQNPPYWEDPAYESYTTGSPVAANRWGVVLTNGDSVYLRPDNDVYNPDGEYLYHYPTVINNGNVSVDSTFFVGEGGLFGFGDPLSIFFDDPDNDTIDNQGYLIFRLNKISCYQIDTAYTCKSEGLGMAYIRPYCPECGIDDYGGVPFDPDGSLSANPPITTGDEYYKTAWVARYGIAQNPFYSAGDTVNASTYQLGQSLDLNGNPIASDTIVGLYAGFYHVYVEDAAGCKEFVRYLNVLEPIDTFKTVIDTVVDVLCKYDNTGEIHVINSGGFDSRALGWSSQNEDGSFGAIDTLSIASKTSRYTLLIRDTSHISDPIANNPCNDINTLNNANYVDTIAQIYGEVIIWDSLLVDIDIAGEQDSIIFHDLYAGRYLVHVYDSLPDSDYSMIDPFTGKMLDSAFNYLACPNAHEIYIQEPCDSLFTSVTVIDNVACWGDSTGIGAGQAIGGTFPYFYQWNNAPFGVDSLGEANDTAYSLWADTSIAFPSATWHTLTTTDSHGCQRKDSIQMEHRYEKITPFYLDNNNDTVFEIRILQDSVTCYGDCDGVAELQTTGGAGLPHTYLWDYTYTSFNQPDTVNDLCEGGHSVLVTDILGCKELITFRIYEPDTLIVIGTLSSPISCYEYDNGAAQAQAIGGNIAPPTTPYSYSWQLDPTLYTHLEDSLFWLGDTNNLGQSLGNQTSQFTGPIFPPTNTAPFTETGHVVTVTDYKGCTAYDTVNFIEPAMLWLLPTDTVYAYCDDTESARICVQAIGGTANYIYTANDQYLQNNIQNPTGHNEPFCIDSLTPANDNSSSGNCNPNDYWITVVDDRFCYADICINIDSATNTFNYASSVAPYISVQHATCNGDQDGSITINNVTGGTAPYTFLWLGPAPFSQTTQSISSLGNGDYMLNITDALGCPIQYNIFINEPEPLEFAIYGHRDATCIGDLPSLGSCDGQIIIEITGGAGGPYLFDLDEAGVYPLTNTQPIVSPGDTLIDDLCAGVHTLFITDASGCESEPVAGQTGIHEIFTDVVVTADLVTPVTSAICADSASGQAFVDLSANPWSGSIDYTWHEDAAGSPTMPPLGAGSSFTSFLPGDYWLAANWGPNTAPWFGNPIAGCEALTPFTINSPTPIVINDGNSKEPSCWGFDDGELNINISGGVGPYTWIWDTTALGYYIPNQVTPVGTTSGINIVVDVLSPPNSSDPPTGIIAGTYTITVTDAAGCQMTLDIEIDQPDQLQNNFSGNIDPLCDGSDGTIQFDIEGGTIPYSFTWNPVAPATIPTNNPGLPLWDFSAGEGTYNVTIIDANGCELETSTILESQSPISITLEPKVYGTVNGIDMHTSCANKDDGEIVVVATGGNPPYTYSIDGTPVNSSTITNVSAGFHTIGVKDANNCPEDETITLVEPDELKTNSVITNVNCYGGNDGEIKIYPTGGIPDNSGAYTYEWSPSVDFNAGDDSHAVGLQAGIPYTVTLIAQYGCKLDETNTLTSPLEEFNATVTTLNYGGPIGQGFGVVFIDATTDAAGNPIDVNHSWCWSYTTEEDYSYDPPLVDTTCNPIENTTNSQGLPITHVFEEVGVHNVALTVTNNATGCHDKIEFPPVVVQGIPDPINNVFTPNGDGKNDEFGFGEIGMKDVEVAIYNRWGEEVYSWEGSDQTWDGKGTNGQDLSEGVYFYVIKALAEDGYFHEKKGTVTLLR